MVHSAPRHFNAGQASMKTQYTRKYPVRSLIATLVVGAILGVALDRVLFAQQAALKRTVLLTTDDPAGAGYNAIMALVELPPGARAGKHRHPGIEIGYIIEGSVLLEHEGRPAATIKAG